MEGLSKSTKGMVALARNPSTLATKPPRNSNSPVYSLLASLPPPPDPATVNSTLAAAACHVKWLLCTRFLIIPGGIAPVSNEGDEYSISVIAIKIDSAPITFNSSVIAIDKDGIGGTKFGTLTPYTVLHSAIFKPLVEEFTKKATDREIKKVAPLALFGACFDAKTVKSGVVGSDVLAIMLVLQGDVQWRIEGANSMVRVSKDVMCLGFLDGGLAAILIGGHQLEDNLVEFEVGPLKFRFSNSLLLQNSSCSHV